MKKQNAEKDTAWGNFVKALHLPEVALGNECHLQLHGQRELVIDNAKGILEYDEQYIKLFLGDKSLIVEGKDLKIDVFMEKTIILRGQIQSLSFS